ncbi:uncharacterized protein LOC130653898 [Hydractinia symbiolongicarpus]|uniref:uncharacterized protein LOC130653898 n=1 Tax=Hydractinia symbiolongicarpus TaxID=13093 RepID=UPI0025517E0B|nr:uncharacterized protein LOC130653898 [Hydractinia symbiolongicarpus]
MYSLGKVENRQSITKSSISFKDGKTIKIPTEKDKGNAIPENVPERCKKVAFIKAHGKNEDIDNLRNCTQYYPTCKHQVGTLTTTYAEDSNGKTLIIFQATDIKKQGCLGYLLQLTDDIETKDVYFNFDNEDADFMKVIYFRLGFTYNFTVTPLPGGESLSIVTKAPTNCELEVIKIIYYKLKKEKKLFADCNQPSYTERKRIATEICKKYPSNGPNRWRTTQNLLTEQKCKFVLLPNNSLSR